MAILKTKYDKVKEWRSRPEAKVMRAAQARRWREKHKDTAAAIKKRYRESNIEERREVERIAAAKKRKADPEAQRARYVRWNSKKEIRLTEIAGRPRAERCEICGEQGKTVFDHCHASGDFRGWLCDRCNRTLGQVKDNVGLLAKMIAYLEDHNGRINDQTQEISA